MKAMTLIQFVGALRLGTNYKKNLVSKETKNDNEHCYCSARMDSGEEFDPDEEVRRMFPKHWGIFFQILEEKTGKSTIQGCIFRVALIEVICEFADQVEI